MHGLFLLVQHRSPILLVGLLVLSTPSLWAQRIPPLEKIPIQLLDTPAPFARVSEAQTCRHFTYRELPLTFEQNPGQTATPMKFFPRYPDYYRLPVNNNAALHPAPRTAELWRKEMYLIADPRSKWLTFAPTYGKVSHETVYTIENLEHLAHGIPWVGPVILRIGQQAKAHPHFARALTAIKPRF